MLLIKDLKSAYTDVTHTWYADDYGTLGKFDNLEICFNSLKCHDPAQGYYPDTTKIILIVHLKISNRGNYLAGVMGLRCARAHFILTIISGTTNPKAIVSKSGRKK